MTFYYIRYGIYVLFAQGPAVLFNPSSLSNFQRGLLKSTYDMEHPLAWLSCKYVMKWNVAKRFQISLCRSDSVNSQTDIWVESPEDRLCYATTIALNANRLWVFISNSLSSAWLCACAVVRKCFFMIRIYSPTLIDLDNNYLIMLKRIQQFVLN